MHSTTARPRVTLLAGGACLIVAGATLLAVAVGVRPFPTVGLSVASAVLLLAAACILALGVGGEPGIAGASRIGRAALIVFGARDLVGLIVDAIPIGPDAYPLAIAVTSALSVVFAVAALVAGVFVARAGILRGPARWALLVVAVCHAIIAALMLSGTIEVAWFLVAARADIVLPGLFLLLGVVYLSLGLAWLPRRVSAVRR
ncbi:MAG TPA: hypothetical protein VGC18_11375 [Lacisediminihabitans sp.]|uniref:hypothetical protein n=1 Tax=Lacisediminihabitans sp. TaxID=2787631 RepID=UPI002ED81EA7